RELTGLQQKFITISAVLLSIFAIYANSLVNMQEIYRNIIFLGFIFVLGLLLYPALKKSDKTKISLIDIILVIVGISGILYILFNYTTIHEVQMSQATTTDYVFAVISIIVMLEVARRSIGIFIPILSVLAIVYAVFGPHFPGVFGHAGFSLERLLFRIYMTTEGIFGMTLSIATTYIILFI